MTNDRKQFTFSTCKKTWSSVIQSLLGGHRLMSRLPSQFLLLPASLTPTFSKKGCLRESASASLLEGSYSSMLSMRSNNWWCSSASDNKYRWQEKVKHKEMLKITKKNVTTSVKYDFLLVMSSFSALHPFLLPVEVYSFLWRIFLQRSFRPSPDGHGKNTFASWKSTDIRHQYVIAEFNKIYHINSYLVLRIILEGTGPRILSIIAKCSLLSWVWK